MIRIVTLFLLTICIFSGIRAENLETVSDEELLNLIKSEKYVVALFTKKDCDACDKIETEMVHIREDLIDFIGAWVIKVVNSQLLRLYNTEKEPALVFFRHGIPLLYEGNYNDEEILNLFLKNDEPTVKELTDETFEHFTQASSGATTGDWFVMFHSTDCVECVRMVARWEGVGAKLKQHINVARVDKNGAGASTARRFNVYQAPQFIFFRHGKMYRYQIPKYDINSFVSFAKIWYKNARAENIPAPLSPFDDLTQMIANTLRDNPGIIKFGSMIIGVFVVISIILSIKHKRQTPEKKD